MANRLLKNLSKNNILLLNIRKVDIMEVTVNYEKVGDKIRERRNFLKITQENLANDIGVSASFISDIENGRRKMSLETIIKISITLKTSLDYFVLDNVKDVKINNKTKFEELKNILGTVDENKENVFLDFAINSAKFLSNKGGGARQPRPYSRTGPPRTRAPSLARARWRRSRRWSRPKRRRPLSLTTISAPPSCGY